MADNRAIWADAIKPGIHTFAVDAFNRHPLEIANVFKIFSTVQAYEDFKDSWSFGRMVKTAEGAPSYQQDYQEGYKTRLIPEGYSLEHVLTHRLKADDLYGVFNNVGGEMGKSAVETANYEGFSVLRNAFSTSFLSYGDRVPLCSTAHTRPDGFATNQSNASSTGITLTEANLETADLALREVFDGRGNILNLMPYKAMLIVPPALKKEALIITQSTLRSGTGNHDKNVYLGNFDVYVNQYISSKSGGSDTAWFLLIKEIGGLVFLWREKPATDSWLDNRTRNLHMSIWSTFDFGWISWYGFWGSQGDGADYSS